MNRAVRHVLLHLEVRLFRSVALREFTESSVRNVYRRRETPYPVEFSTLRASEVVVGANRQADISRLRACVVGWRDCGVSLEHQRRPRRS